jgi:hypothetical protein
MLDVAVDPGLLQRALTHRSYAYENGGLPTTERLEFLGDSVLGLVDQRVEQAVHQAGGSVQALVDVDGTEDRLEGVGQDRGLVPAAGGLLAAAEPDVVAQGEVAAHIGEGPHVDDRGAQLGQLPLRQLGVATEQRVGHDQAEHRVAEELQPLVGGQPTVLDV